MTLQGYIKLYRTFQNNIFYKNSDAVHLWIHLLFCASFEDNVFYYKNTKINLKRGQLITGRKKLSQETGINESKIFRLLKLFESEHQIEQQKTSQYSIITIISYDTYNESEHQIEQQMNNKRTTNEQQMNTTKELKEIKELKEDNIIQESENFICLNDEEKKSRKKLLAKTIDKIYCSPFRFKEEQNQTIEWILADKDFKECISPILAYFKNHYKRELEDKRIGEKINGLNWLFYNPQNYFLVKQTFEQEVKNGTIHYTI